MKAKPDLGTYMAIGIAIGVAIGTAMDNIGLGIAIGVAGAAAYHYATARNEPDDR